MSLVEPIYGTADWAAGFTNGEPVEEISQEIQGEVTGEISGGYDEWSYVQKVLMFAVIIGCVAVYIRISKRRSARENIGYEKTMA